MPHKPDGPCAVCGVETTQRCSSCAEYGFDLFLCGREHQKLVWFVHKRVCGENANPFTFPLLSLKETADIKAHLDEPAMRSNSEGLTLKGHLEGLNFVDGQPISLLDYIDSVTEGGHTRSFCGSVQRAAILHEREPFSKLSVFFGRLAAHLPNSPTDSFSRTFSSKLDTYTSLFHHAVVVAAVDYQCSKKVLAYYASGGRNPNWGAEPADAALLRSYIGGQHRVMQAVMVEIRVKDAAFAEAAARELANLSVFGALGMAFDGWVQVPGADGNVGRSRRWSRGFGRS